MPARLSSTCSRIPFKSGATNGNSDAIYSYDRRGEENSVAENSSEGIEKRKALQEAEEQAAASFDSFERVEPRVVGSVTLPLPRDIRFSDNAQYDFADLGVIGGALEGGLQGQNPFAGVTQNGQFSSTVSSLAAQAVAKAAPLAAGAAVGSVAPTPLRLPKVEELFRGKKVDEALLQRAGDVAEAEIKPISDVRSTMEYRSSVTRSLLRDAIEDALRSRL